MSFDYKKERVNCHNNFPNQFLFETERKFKELIDKNCGVTPFTPIKINYNDDFIFQTCIGHFIDGLELLPFRPDYMFDQCFKVIDLAGKSQFPSSKGIKGIVQGLGNKLLKLPNNKWVDIINLLSLNIPISTASYIVRRIFESESIRLKNNDDHKSRLAKRAKDCFISGQYDEFIRKFTFDSNGMFSSKIALEPTNLSNATKFLLMMLRCQKGHKPKDPTYPLLDLSNVNNHFLPNKKCEFITSILLYNIRNDRAHGSTLSPFRSSRSNIDRYEGYYYIMLCAYIISLGIFELNKFGGFTSSEIYNCCHDNINKIKKLFHPKK